MIIIMLLNDGLVMYSLDHDVEHGIFDDESQIKFQPIIIKQTVKT